MPDDDAGVRRERRDRIAHREAILSAAQEVFTRADGGTMSDVAALSGLTRATVYRYFPDRDALVEGLVQRLAAPTADELVRGLAGRPLPEGVEHLARAVLSLVEELRPLLRLIGTQLQEVARAVEDEPLVTELRRRRQTGELTAPMSDSWIAAAVRALCLAAVSDTRASEEVHADLVEALRRLVC